MTQTTQWPSVPGGLVIPGYGNGQIKSQAEGAKNHRGGPGYHGQRTLHIATYNIRTLSTEQKTLELEEELIRIKWDILGLSEVNRRGENQIALKSGHLLQYKGEENIARGGVGFMVHKKHIKDIVKIESICSRVIYLILKLNKRYTIKIIQVYAPTTDHNDEEIENFYEDIYRAMQQDKTHYTLLMGDFNAKLGHREDEAETAVGPFGYGERNNRGDMLLDFLLQHNLFAMNSFFEKAKQRRWTWASPNGTTKNEIDFIICNKKNIVHDVTVLNKFSVGSDHRLVRAKVKINMRVEREKIIRKNKSKKWTGITDKKTYQTSITSDLGNQESLRQDDLNVDDLNTHISVAVRNAQEKYKDRERDRRGKISETTKNLISVRREMRRTKTLNPLPIQRQINKDISKTIRNDIRTYNTSSNTG